MTEDLCHLPREGDGCSRDGATNQYFVSRSEAEPETDKELGRHACTIDMSSEELADHELQQSDGSLIAVRKASEEDLICRTRVL